MVGGGAVDEHSSPGAHTVTLFAERGSPVPKSFTTWKPAKEAAMDQSKRDELETRLKDALKEHQREGLNMIGNVDQLVRRLVQAVEQWVDEDRLAERERKSA
jgi:hypothetical protein